MISCACSSEFRALRVSKVLPCAESAVPYAEVQVPADHSGLPYERGIGHGGPSAPVKRGCRMRVWR